MRRRQFMQLKKVLEDVLAIPEMMAIPWEDCLHAAQKHYGLSEEWFRSEMRKADKMGSL